MATCVRSSAPPGHKKPRNQLRHVSVLWGVAGILFRSSSVDTHARQHRCRIGRQAARESALRIERHCAASTSHNASTSAYRQPVRMQHALQQLRPSARYPASALLEQTQTPLGFTLTGIAGRQRAIAGVQQRRTSQPRPGIRAFQTLRAAIEWPTIGDGPGWASSTAAPSRPANRTGCCAT